MLVFSWNKTVAVPTSLVEIKLLELLLEVEGYLSFHILSCEIIKTLLALVICCRATGIRWFQHFCGSWVRGCCPRSLQFDYKEVEKYQLKKVVIVDVTPYTFYGGVACWVACPMCIEMDRIHTNMCGRLREEVVKDNLCAPQSDITPFLMMVTIIASPISQECPLLLRRGQ